MASAADRMVYEGYFMLLSGSTRLYCVISAGTDYAKVGRDGIQNILSNNRLARVAKERRLSMAVKRNAGTSTDTNLYEKRQSTRNKVSGS